MCNKEIIYIYLSICLLSPDQRLFFTTKKNAKCKLDLRIMEQVYPILFFFKLNFYTNMINFYENVRVFLYLLLFAEIHATATSIQIICKSSNGNLFMATEIRLCVRFSKR